MEDEIKETPDSDMAEMPEEMKTEQMEARPIPDEIMGDEPMKKEMPQKTEGKKLGWITWVIIAIIVIIVILLFI